MFHRNLSGYHIHVPHAWTYADATARLAATGFVAADVGKLALQLAPAPSTLWMLMDDSPISWVAMTASGRTLWIKTAAPTVNDDGTQGYNVGDEWYYNHTRWLCVSNATGAADWQTLSAGDLLNPLSLPEVSVTGAVVLDATAYGRMHVCSTSAAYTITLPTAVGYAGQFIAFRMASANTYIVTLDANGSQLIGTKLTRPYVHDEQVIIMSDGANWRVMNEFLIKVGFGATHSTTQSIPDAANTKVSFDTEEYDDDNCFDSVTNYRFQPKAPGLYDIHFKLHYITATANRYLNLSLTHSTKGNIILHAMACSLNGATFVMNGSLLLRFNGSTEYLEAYAHHIQGGAKNIQYQMLTAHRLSNV